MRWSVVFPIIHILYLISVVKSSKILGVFPVTGRSHYILGSSLMRALAERGHNVTIISPFGEHDLPKNGSYRDIVLTGFIDEMNKMLEKMNLFETQDDNIFLQSLFMLSFIKDVSEQTLSHPNVQKLIQSDETFDAVIVEQFTNDGHKALANHFGAPLILFSAIPANSLINSMVGNPSPPSYIPELMTNFSPKMSFFERLINTLLRNFNELLYQFYLRPHERKSIKKHIPNSRELDDVMYNASIALLNSHPSISQPVPHVPNMIEIGGFHIKPPKKLPEDLQKFLDNAKEGVIYFSMGSALKSADLPADKRDSFLRTFAKLPQKVLWKWEADELPGKPANVKLGKWLPQQEILAHPNVKVFITHGGLLSTTETVYHGVPILAIPIFADQKMNAKMSADNGLCIILPFAEITEDKLTENLQELLENPKYSSNAKTRSRIFHDRLVKPIDEAIYWIEYVIRHGGSPHLRVAGLDLPLYKYLLLDVIAFLIIVNFLLIYVSWVVTKKLFYKLRSRSSEKEKKKVKKN